MENENIEIDDFKIVDQDGNEQSNTFFEQPQAPKKQKSLFVNTWYFKMLMIFGIAFVGFIFSFQVALTPIMVVGSSMQPTINKSIKSETDESHNDIVYYSKNENYDIDDILIVANNDYIKSNEVELFIKRVVGTPGQTVKFSLTSNEGNYYEYKVQTFDSNGNEIELDDSFDTMTYQTPHGYINFIYVYSNESYIDYWRNHTEFGFYADLLDGILNSADHTFSITLGDDEYFVLGDNRNNSTDSRFFGPIKFNDIEGSVKLLVPYGNDFWSVVFQEIKKKIKG